MKIYKRKNIKQEPTATVRIPYSAYDLMYKRAQEQNKTIAEILDIAINSAFAIMPFKYEKSLGKKAKNSLKGTSL